MYKLRYGRTYNLGNYQSERVEVERDFNEDIPIDRAAEALAVDVKTAHAGVRIDKEALEKALVKLGVPPPRYKDKMEGKGNAA